MLWTIDLQEPLYCTDLYYLGKWIVVQVPNHSAICMNVLYKTQLDCTRAVTPMVDGKLGTRTGTYSHIKVGPCIS